MKSLHLPRQVSESGKCEVPLTGTCYESESFPYFKEMFTMTCNVAALFSVGQTPYGINIKWTVLDIMWMLYVNISDVGSSFYHLLQHNFAAMHDHSHEK